MAFALTKIQPPRPRAGSLLARPALEQRLSQALLSQRLVLVCAAAGFGKTSLLARQAAQLPAGTGVAWVACDEGDSPVTLLECLLAALEPFDPPWRASPEALMRQAAEAVTAAQRRTIAAEIINALDACELPHGVIVVDDLHRVGSGVLCEFLDALLERFTPRWTMALASRDEPPLAVLPRLRAQGDVAEFRPADLRFERDEALALGGAHGLDPALADRLYERTQGWPVGLRLAVNAASSLPPGGALSAAGGAMDRHAFDYMTAEVIDHLRPELREFLLATSVLPELAASRCQVLSGDLHAAARLDDIERAGLFATPLASSEPTLRLHDLFRESLETRLRRDRPLQWQSALQAAAATETDPLRRVTWWQRAGCWDEAERDLSQVAESGITQGQASALAPLLDGFSAARREGSARLQLVRAQIGWSRWDWDTAIDATERAAALLAEADDPVGARAALSYHCVALAGANHPGARAVIDELLAHRQLDGDSLARTLVASSWIELRGGDQRQVAPLWERLLTALAGIDSLPRWYECCPLPPFVGLPGMRAPLQRYVTAALARVPELPTPLRGMCQVVQGWLHLWVGDIDQAEACADAADSDARWLARPVNVDSYARSLRAVVVAIRGRHEASAALMQQLIDEVTASANPLRTRVYRGFYVFMALRCAALADDRDTVAARAAQLLDEQSSGHGWLSPQQLASAPAYAALCRGALDAAVGHWQELLAHEEAADIYGQVVETRLRLADALLQLGRSSADAVAVLQPLFERLAASGEWGALMMAGPSVLSRLAAFDWQGALSADERAQLRQAADRLKRPAAAVGVTGVAAPPAVLSAREADVLARIAAGDSNKLIARAFDLSPHTVKRHVANILDKLGLASRGQAAAWYRAHL